MTPELKVGHVGVVCPDCGLVIDVTVTARIEGNDRAHLGEAELVCEADMADVWAHGWTHDE